MKSGNDRIIIESYIAKVENGEYGLTKKETDYVLKALNFRLDQVLKLENAMENIEEIVNRECKPENIEDRIKLLKSIRESVKRRKNF